MNCIEYSCQQESRDRTTVCKTPFLYGDLEYKIYIQQVEGFVMKGKENLVCRLRNSFYGLKQAPRQWYKKFESFMLEHGFHKTQAQR